MNMRDLLMVFGKKGKHAKRAKFIRIFVFLTEDKINKQFSDFEGIFVYALEEQQLFFDYSYT